MTSSITRLKQPITRRVGGDHLVTLNEHTVEIREARSNQSYTVSYAELMLNVAAANRKKAFERAAPKGWKPQPGDEVYIRERIFCSSTRATGMVIGPPDNKGWVMVRIDDYESQINPRNLRPA